MSAPSTLSQDGLEYNVPDVYERNPEIIRAEMALLNTPATQVYSAEAYNAIKNVQTQCAMDYKNICSPVVTQQVYTLSIPDIFSHLDMVFGHRALTETQDAAFESKGAKLVKSLQSYYKPANKVEKSHKDHKIWTTSNSKNNLRGGGRRLKSKETKDKERKTKNAEMEKSAIASGNFSPEALPPKPRVTNNVRLSPGPMVKKFDTANLLPKAAHNLDGQVLLSQQQNAPPLRGPGPPKQLFQQGEVNGHAPPPRPNGPNGNGPPPPRFGFGLVPPPRPVDENGPPPRKGDGRGNGPPPRPNDGNGPPPRGPPPPRGDGNGNGPPPRGPPPGKDGNGPPPRPGGDHHGEKPKGPDHQDSDSDSDDESKEKSSSSSKDKKEGQESKREKKQLEKEEKAVESAAEKAAKKPVIDAAVAPAAPALTTELTKGAGGRPNGFVPALGDKAKETTTSTTTTATTPAADVKAVAAAPAAAAVKATTEAAAAAPAVATKAAATEAVSTTTEKLAPAGRIRDLFMVNGRLSALANRPQQNHIEGNALPMDDMASTDVISSDASFIPHNILGSGFQGLRVGFFNGLLSSDSDSGSDSDNEGEGRRGRGRAAKRGSAAAAQGAVPMSLPPAGPFGALGVMPTGKGSIDHSSLLHSMDWGHKHDDDADDHHKGRGPPEGPPRDHKGPPPPPPHDGRGPPPPPPPGGEDVFFSGALGYGAEDDMCMYENFNQLSEPCQESVAELYQLRDEYWHESSGPPHGHCMFGAFLLLGLVAVVGVRKYMAYGRKKKVRNFLSMIHANPELKASVEAETGMKVPEIRCGGLRHPGSQAAEMTAAAAEGEEEKPKYSCCAKLCMNVMWFVGLFLLSFYLAISSLEDTGRIIMYMDRRIDEQNAQDDVNAPPPSEGVSVPGALAILFLVCSIKIAFTCLLIKGCGNVYKYFKGHKTNTNGGSTASAGVVGDDYVSLPSPTDGPSAPPSSPVYKPKTRYTAVNVAAASAPMSTNNLVVPTGVPRIWGRWSTPSASSGFFSARRANGYAPVNGHDQDTEMTSVSPLVSAQVQSAQQAQQQQYVLVPVTATPVSGSGFTMV